MRDLLGSETIENGPVNVNIYADESLDRECTINKDNRWHYIGLCYLHLS